MREWDEKARAMFRDKYSIEWMIEFDQNPKIRIPL